MRLGLFPAEYVEQLPALEPQTRRRSSSRSASGSPSRIPDPEPELVQPPVRMEMPTLEGWLEYKMGAITTEVEEDWHLGYFKSGAVNKMVVGHPLYTVPVPCATCIGCRSDRRRTANRGNRYCATRARPPCDPARSGIFKRPSLAKISF